MPQNLAQRAAPANPIFGEKTLWRAALLAVWALGSGPAQAQDTGWDGGLPDASVAEGGADRDNPEREDQTGRAATTCLENADCERGFACEQGRCVHVGYQRAAGCSALPGMPWAWAAAVVGWTLRRRRRASATSALRSSEGRHTSVRR